MPLNRFRNYQALMNLVPGHDADGVRQRGDRHAGAVARDQRQRPGRTRNNSTRTDGATNMNIWLPNHNMYISPAETVDTVNVSTSSFDAEQGNGGRRGGDGRHQVGHQQLQGLGASSSTTATS